MFPNKIGDIMKYEEITSCVEIRQYKWDHLRVFHIHNYRKIQGTLMNWPTNTHTHNSTDGRLSLVIAENSTKVSAKPLKHLRSDLSKWPFHHFSSLCLRSPKYRITSHKPYRPVIKRSLPGKKSYHRFTSHLPPQIPHREDHTCLAQWQIHSHKDFGLGGKGGCIFYLVTLLESSH